MVEQYGKITISLYFDETYSNTVYINFQRFLIKIKGNIVETDGLPDFLVTKTPILESNGAPNNLNPNTAQAKENIDRVQFQGGGGTVQFLLNGFTTKKPPFGGRI